MVAVKRGCDLRLVDPALLNDKELVMESMRHNPYGSQLKIATAFQSDKEVVMESVTHCFNSLQYASPDLKADKEVVMAAVKNMGQELKYASPDLRDDKEVVMTSIPGSRYWNVLGWVSPRLQSDKEVVLAAVKHYGMALNHASPDLKQDKEVVLAAVHQNGKALAFADALRADVEVVCAAIQNTREALPFVDTTLDGNDQFIQCMIRHRVTPVGRPILKDHIMKRLKMKTVSKSLPDPIREDVTRFLGGRTRKRIKKRNRTYRR